jgi:hypothetical protein
MMVANQIPRTFSWKYKFTSQMSKRGWYRQAGSESVAWPLPTGPKPSTNEIVGAYPSESDYNTAIPRRSRVSRGMKLLTRTGCMGVRFVARMGRKRIKTAIACRRWGAKNWFAR